MSGAGLAADVPDPVNHPFGRMFIPTGNGDFTATIPYASGMDYGDSILDLDLTNGALTVQDDFTPMGQANLDAYDGDQASGGLMILPNQTTGSYTHGLVQSGKSGAVYLLNRDNLGGYNPSGDTVVPSHIASGASRTGPRIGRHRLITCTRPFRSSSASRGRCSRMRFAPEPAV